MTTVSPRLMAEATMLRFLDDYARALENVVETCSPYLSESELAALLDHIKATERLNKTLGAGASE